jgi:hypothetical protein
MTPEQSNALVTTKTETFHELDYSDFERIVNGVYGHDYCYAAEEELSNDSVQRYTVENKPLDEWAAKDIEKYINTGQGIQYRASTLLQDLALKGYLPFGEYIVEVCW